jgi:hypothetical protein
MENRIRKTEAEIQKNMEKFWSLRTELVAGGMSKPAANRNAYNRIIRRPAPATE